MVKEHILADTNIKRLLIKLSVPATIGMISMSLYNVIDAIFVGHGVGPKGIAGISIVFPIQMFMLAIGLLIGVGGASLISRSLGAGKIDLARKTFGTILLSILTISGFITILGLIFITPLLKLFGATTEIYSYAEDYMSIILLGAFFFTFIVVNNNIIRSEGHAKIAMTSMILSAGLNIIFDPVFIFGFKLGIKGAALATILSQFLVACYIMIYYLSGKSTFKLNFTYFRYKYKILKEVFSVGSASFARIVSGSVILIMLNNILESYGGFTAIAIYGIIHRILRFIYMPIYGIGQGLQPIVGYNYGSKRYKYVIKSIKMAIIGATLIISVNFILMMIFPEIFLSIFSNDKEIIKKGVIALRLVILAVPLVGFQVIGSIVFQAIGRANQALILTISRRILFFIPLLLILPKLFKLKGVWIVTPISTVLSFILTFILFYRLMSEFAKKT